MELPYVASDGCRDLVHDVLSFACRAAADGRANRRPFPLLFRTLLPCHRDAQGLFRVEQVILGILGNRGLYTLDLAVEGATRGAGATISNSRLWRFFRRCE
jgi:hypothetical protein